MLSVNEVIGNLMNELNDKGDIFFNLQRYGEQFYDNIIRDRDGKPYVAGVVYELEMPRIETFYTTRRKEYTISVKLKTEILDEVKAIINQVEQFKVDDNTYYLSNLIIDDEKVEREGNLTTKVVFGTLRLGVAIPTFITGKDVIIKVDGVKVNVVASNQIFDKALLSTVKYGDNTSDINTGAEYTFSFIVDTNQKVNDILGNILDNKFNKIFNFEINYITHTANMDLVLRRGIVSFDNNDNPLGFQATFERALPRKEIKINGHKVQAISFLPQLSIEPLVKNNSVATIRMQSVSRNYSFYLVNDKSDLIDDIINEFKDYKSKKWVLEYEINDIPLTANCLLTNLAFVNEENPDTVLQVSFGEGLFYDNDI